MTRDLFAVWTLLMGLLVGFLGMVMFYGQESLGINFSLWVALNFAAVMGSAWYARRSLTWRNLWLLLPVLFFSVMVAVRASEWLLFWNVVVTLTLAGLALHYMGITKPFDLTSNLVQFGNLIEVGIRVPISEPIFTLVASRKWFGSREVREVKHAGAIIRGLVITIPVLGAFAILLSSADAVFESYMNQIPTLFQFEDIDAFIGRLVLMGVLAWFAVGAITYGVLRHWRRDDSITTEAEAAIQEIEEATQAANTDEEEKPPKRGAFPFRVGIIEAVMLLGGVNLLFAAFVVIQAVYLFGGSETVSVQDLTYAEYARRGFFELVTTAVMSMGLILFADQITVREGKRENMLFRVLSFVVIALVGVMLVSAARRMMLYTDEFGLTQLRLWTSVFMGWLAVLFGFLVAGLLRLRQNIFSLGVVISAIGFFATMNVINPDYRIASHNLERALADSGEELDVCYLSYLSADATGVIFDAFQRAEGDNKEKLGMLLKTRLQKVEWADNDSEKAIAFFAYNASASREAGMLNGNNGMLSEYLTLYEANEYYCIRIGY